MGWIEAIKVAASRLGVRRGDDAQGDDFLQEALARAIASGAAISHPRAFISRIARNIAIDETRKLKVRGGAALQFDALPDSAAPWVGPDKKRPCS